MSFATGAPGAAAAARATTKPVTVRVPNGTTTCAPIGAAGPGRGSRYVNVPWTGSATATSRKLPPASSNINVGSLLCGGLRQHARHARAHVVRDVRALQRVVHHRDDVAGAIADVVPAAFDLQPREAVALAQRRQPVGQLDLAALAGLRLGEDRGDLRGQHVAADDRHARRRRAGRGLLDQLADRVL